VAISTSSFAAHGSSEPVKIVPTKPPPSVTAVGSLAANRKASRTNQPMIAE
jgi:hypothetical protein